MARLTSYVHVHHPEKGTVAFGPGDDVPAWAKKQITRDDVWDTNTPAASDDNSSSTSTDEPPRTGKGSGKEAWVTYATEILELEVPEDAGREDIFALVDERNADG